MITFGPDKPRRPVRRPRRRAVVAGLTAAACAAVLATGILVVRRDGPTAPDGTAASTPSATPSTARTRAQPAAPTAPTAPTAPPCPAAPEMTALVFEEAPTPDLSGTLESCDPEATAGPWTVVVRRQDGALGRHGAVVTFPAERPVNGLPVSVNGTAGVAVGGSVIWPLGRSYARVRGDLDQAALLAIAAGTTAGGGRPRVRPPAGYRAVWSGPYRAPAIHEVRYGSADVGEVDALGGGLVYTGITSGGGGFEDQLYLRGQTDGGTVRGARAVLSGVHGGNGTLAWELQPGMVAYVGYSGSTLDDPAAAALLRLANRARLLSLAEWWSGQPQTTYQSNEPR